MKDKIIHLIASEDSRNPMTDEEIAETLGIFRETVTNIRKEAGLGDSRERRKAAVFQDMKELLNMDPDLTERGLTRCLAERGYVIGKYAVGKLKEELLKEWQPEPEYGKTGEEIQDGSRFFSKVIGYAGSMKSQIKQVQAAILYPPKGLHCLLYGPSGVGKSYLAEIMHEYAPTHSNDDLLALYTFTGGVPKYVELFCDNHTLHVESMIHFMVRDETMCLSLEDM